MTEIFPEKIRKVDFLGKIRIKIFQKFFEVFIHMSKHIDKINAMKTAGKAMEDRWSKSKITPEKNEELMKQKIGEIITNNRKKGFSFFR